jgi:hypothetical protein
MPLLGRTVDSEYALLASCDWFMDSSSLQTCSWSGIEWRESRRPAQVVERKNVFAQHRTLQLPNSYT